MNLMETYSKNSYGKIYLDLSLLVFCFCVLDILLFPYIRILSCSCTMLIVIVWYLFHIKYALKMNMVLCVLSIGLSVAFAYLLLNSTKGIITSVLVVYSMMLFYYIEKNFKNYKARECLSRIFFIYITVVFIFTVIYIVSPQTYFTIRSFWTMGNTQIEFSSHVINRFTFIYSDPNNAGCAFVAILAYVLICEKHKTVTYIYYMTALTISVLTTFSIQSIVMLIALFFALMFVVSFRSTRKVKIAFIIIIIIVGFALFLAFFDASWMAENKIIKGLLYRFGNSNVDTGGGRVAYWKESIEEALSWYNIFIGKGAVINAKGETLLPHSGHLYMVISYGLLVEILFCKTMFVFHKHTPLKYYLVIIPLFVVFTMNTGINDYRFISVLSFVSSCTKNVSYEERHL